MASGRLSTLFTFLSAASLAGTACAIVQHISSDAGALALYGLGILPGLLFAGLVTSRLSAGKQSKEPRSAQNTEAKTPAVTPRSLIKSVSASDSQLVPVSAVPAPHMSAFLEVEYSLDEYESMREKQRAEAAPSSSRRGKKTPSKAAAAKTPDSTRRRQSGRTPKAVSRYGAE